MGALEDLANGTSQPLPKGMLVPGNLNLTGRPVVKNNDGSISTEYSTSFEDDQGREVLVPTIVNGKFLTPDGKKPPEGSPQEKTMFREAQKQYQKTGQHLGIFDNPDDSDAYATRVHQRQLSSDGLPVYVLPQVTQSGGSALESLAQGDGTSLAMPAGPSVSDIGNSIVGSLKDSAGDVARGFANGVGDTVHGTGELIRKVLNAPVYPNSPTNLGDKIIPPEGQKALDQLSTDQNDTQHVGKALENVAEFMLGEGAASDGAKALSVGDKLKELGSVGKFLEAHPTVAKMLGGGTKAALVSGAQTTAKTGSPTEGAEGAATGAVAGAIAEPIKPLFTAIKNAVNPSAIPEALSKDSISVLNDFSQREGLPALKSATARDAGDELQQNFVNRAKAQYAPVDKAVGGDLKPVQEKITNLKQAIREQANVNPDLADKYTDDLAKQKQTLADLVQKAKANGVPNAEALMTAGDKDYARGMAMKEVSKGMKSASGIAKMGGHPNPTLFASHLDRLHNNGPLDRALGKDGAQAMLDLAKEGLSKAKNASLARKGLIATGAGAAATAGGAVAYHAANGVLSGSTQ